MNKVQMWDYLVEHGIATNEECLLVTSIIGYTEETMLKILYSRTGYRNFEQIPND